VKLVEHSAMERLDPPALGRDEIVGNPKTRKIRKCLLESAQRLLGSGGPRRDPRTIFSLGSQMPEGIGQEVAAIGGIGNAICGHQAQRCLRRQLVLLDRLEKIVLIFVVEGGESGGERRADRAEGEVVLRLRRQTGVEL
jgi:hypothetical protein